MNLNQFGDKINRVAVNVPKNADEIVRKVALAADQTITMATPVDTGRARANWQVGIGVVPTGTVEYSGGGAGAAGYAIGAATNAVTTYKGQPGGIWLVNNLPYIQRLNEGWSAQAPAKFVEQAIDTAVNAIRDSKVVK
jgi:hypothetical protein|nr:MAG TPA: tail component [Caudoviricetes sp.]